MGLVGALVTLSSLAACNTQPQRLIIGCDGLATLTTIQQKQDYITSNTQHWDLISTLHDIWHLMTATPLLTHVKGH